MSFIAILNNIAISIIFFELKSLHKLSNIGIFNTSSHLEKLYATQNISNFINLFFSPYSWCAFHNLSNEFNLITMIFLGHYTNFSSNLSILCFITKLVKHFVSYRFHHNFFLTLYLRFYFLSTYFLFCFFLLFDLLFFI